MADSTLLTTRAIRGSSSTPESWPRSSMPLPLICAGLITSMAGCRTTAHGVVPARRAAMRASLMLIGSAPAAATDFILKPIQTIRTLFIRNRRTARWLALTCARAVAPAFVRALLRSVAAEAEEEVAAAVDAPAAVVARAAELRPQHHLKPARRTNKQRSRHLPRSRGSAASAEA